jgi:hypothetical protein
VPAQQKRTEEEEISASYIAYPAGRGDRKKKKPLNPAPSFREACYSEARFPRRPLLVNRVNNGNRTKPHRRVRDAWLY